jgi:hypothetical protein
MRRLLPAAAAALALLAPTAAHASPTQESTFQDDPLIVYGDVDTLRSTLDAIAGLGADRIRVTVFWKLVAPAPESDTKPAGFDGADPAAYPRGAWERYDRIVAEAAARGLKVNFNVSAPAPHWATGKPPADRPDLKETWLPSPAEFGAFVRAAGARFPQVDYWSIYNEPNQAGWLTPQWGEDPRGGGRPMEFAPHLYRAMVDQAWAALQATGHGNHTILIGETAPKGLLANRGPTRSIDAQRFIKALYCLDDNMQPFRGTSAEVRGCPLDPGQFVAQHPALFQATGFAHHPYELAFPPDRPPPHRDAWVTTGNLGDLQKLLRRIRQRYGQSVKRPMPLYLTEFGYQTNPPDRFGVSRAEQARFLNHAEYITYRRSDVRTLAQFLLVDDGEPVSRTFQSGLLDIARKKKPAFNAYMLPVWLPRERVRRGSPVRVWGMVRPGRPGVRETVRIQVRTRGAKRWRTVRTVRAEPRRGYLNATIRVPRTGHVRLLWRSPGGAERRSRAARIEVVAPRAVRR